MNAISNEAEKIDRISKRDPKALDRIIEEHVRETEYKTSKAAENEADEGNGLAYKEINVYAYYVVTLLLYLLIIIMALTLPRVDIIFDFLGCFTVNAIGFVIPAVLYLKGRKIFAKSIQWTLDNDEPYTVSKKDDLYLKRSAYAQLAMGGIVLVLGVVNWVHTLIE